MKKKVFLTIIAFVLVAAVSVAGTLAYLTNTSNEVTNTFVAAGGGVIIHEDDDGNPMIELYENKVTFDDATLTYAFDTDTTHVTEVSYEKVAPGMDIPKNPILDVTIEAGAAAYIYIVVNDQTDGVIFWQAARAGGTQWKQLGGYRDVYVAELGNPINNSASTEPLHKVFHFLDADHVTVPADATMPENGEIGTLSFTAYACQAQSFGSAEAAFAACFPGVGTPA